MKELESIKLVEKERLRQISQEEFSIEHDAQLAYGELALAGIAYAMPIPLFQKVQYPHSIQFIDPYPWSGGIGDKRKDYAQDPFKDIPEHNDLKYRQKLDLLIKGAALICAEIDRLIYKEEAINIIDQNCK